jgi:hypothetical protein
MTASGWVTFIVIAGFVWGGFGLALYTAMRQESRKKQD